MTTTAPETTGELCPECSSPLVAPILSTMHWCPACEWGLDRYDPAMAPWRGTRWLSRWGFRQAYTLDEALRRDITADASAAGLRSRSSTLLIAISALLVLVSLASFAGAVLVWTRDDWLPPLRLLASAGLLMLGIWARPRFGRLPRSVPTLPPGGAPALRGLVERVASAVGTKEPDIIVLRATDLNIGVGRVGVRGRSVLFLGMPLWLLLTPEMRVAVLAHELGHLNNRDPLRGLLTRPATQVFASAVEWTGGNHPWRRLAARLDEGGNDGLMTILTQVLLALANTFFATIQLGIQAVAMRDHRRAEYAADLTARSVAGSRAAIATLDRLAVLDDLVCGLVHDVETRRPLEWLPLANARHAHLGGELSVRRQATRRMVDLWTTHPPSGTRAALIESLPSIPAAVSVDDAETARIDVELSNWYGSVHRWLLGTREYRG